MDRAAIREELLLLMDEMERRLSERARHKWCPHTPEPRQRAFLDLDAEEALYGGAAGGGKSDALLMGMLRHADIPGFSGLVLRRTFADLSLPGAIMDRAGEWLRPTAAKWDDKKHTWRFPSGARLSFGFLESDNDKYRYQSAEFHSIAFDELTQFSEAQYTYLTSRLRREEGFPVRPYMRAASNPGGRGHVWVHRRFVDSETARFPFVPATIADNPHIDQDDYRSRLDRLDSTTRAQLLEGLWVIDARALIYPLSPANLVPKVPETIGWMYALGVDLGASEEIPTTAFAIPCWHRSLPGTFVASCYKRAGMTPSSIAEEVRELIDTYGHFTVMVADEGALGVAYTREFRDRYSLAFEPAEKWGKLGFRKLLRGDLETARLMLVEPHCGDLIEEMRQLRWDESGIKEPKGSANHCTDAMLYAWRAARGYAGRIPDQKPKPGSPEWLEAERERMLEEDRRRVKRRIKRAKSAAWWE